MSENPFIENIDQPNPKTDTPPADAPPADAPAPVKEERPRETQAGRKARAVPTLDDIRAELVEQLQELLRDAGAEGEAFVRESAIVVHNVVERLVLEGNDRSWLLSHAKARLEQLAAIHLSRVEAMAKIRATEMLLSFTRAALAIASAV